LIFCYIFLCFYCILNSFFLKSIFNLYFFFILMLWISIFFWIITITLLIGEKIISESIFFLIKFSTISFVFDMMSTKCVLHYIRFVSMPTKKTISSNNAKRYIFMSIFYCLNYFLYKMSSMIIIKQYIIIIEIKIINKINKSKCIKQNKYLI